MEDKGAAVLISAWGQAFILGSSTAEGSALRRWPLHLSGDRAYPSQGFRAEAGNKHSCKQWGVPAGGAWYVKRMELTPSGRSERSSQAAHSSGRGAGRGDIVVE